jgi:hypothetical protein
MVGFNGKKDEEGEAGSSVYSGSTSRSVSYCKEIGLGCGGRVAVNEKRG